MRLKLINFFRESIFLFLDSITEIHDLLLYHIFCFWERLQDLLRPHFHIVASLNVWLIIYEWKLIKKVQVIFHHYELLAVFFNHLRYLFDVLFGLDQLFLCLWVIVVYLFVILVDLWDGVIAVFIDCLEYPSFDFVSLFAKIVLQLFVNDSEHWKVNLIINESSYFIW